MEINAIIIGLCFLIIFGWLFRRRFEPIKNVFKRITHWRVARKFGYSEPMQPSWSRGVISHMRDDRRNYISYLLCASLLDGSRSRWWMGTRTFYRTVFQDKQLNPLLNEADRTKLLQEAVDLGVIQPVGTDGFFRFKKK